MPISTLSLPPNLAASPQALHDKAQRIHELIESRFYDPQGLMYCFLDATTHQPVGVDEAGSFPIRELSGGQSAVDWLRYEDTCMTIGSYLSALAHRARAQGGAATDAMLTRAFESVRHLYDLSAAYKEAGWLCKPYGGRASNESTNDQYGAVVLGLRDVARVREFRRAEESRKMAIRLCDYWPAHDYVCPYAGKLNHRWLDRLPWAFVCLSMVRIASELTGDVRYEQEADRICSLGFDTPQPRSGAFRADLYPDEPHRGVRPLSNYHHLVVEHLEAMWQIWSQRRQHWEALLRSFWERDVNMGIDADGLAWGCYEVDLRSNAWKTIPAGWMPGYESPQRRPGFPGHFWVGRFKSGMTTCFVACSAVKIGACIDGLRTACHPVALRTLSAIDTDQMVWVIDPDGDQECPALGETRKKLLVGRALTQWLRAYWQGRELGWW